LTHYPFYGILKTTIKEGVFAMVRENRFASEPCAARALMRYPLKIS